MVLALLIWCAAVSWAQEGSTALHPVMPPLDDVHPLQEAVLPLLIPVIFNNVHELKQMLCDEEFARVRRVWGDRVAVDVVFRWSEQLCWNNRAVALFVAFLATIEHRKVGFRVPWLGPLLWLPLSGEFSEEFDDRVQKLPAHMFPDSPQGEFGDKDKLQHFFGSAFLAYVFGGAEPAERVGDFIEWGEEAFVIDGTYDVRGLEANRRGRRFAEQLREDRQALPSSQMDAPLDAPSTVH
jgi:hypothetical protein